MNKEFRHRNYKILIKFGEDICTLNLFAIAWEDIFVIIHILSRGLIKF
jgi:hypothetical protein